MASSFDARFAIYLLPAFQKRVAIALTRVALRVAGEDVSSIARTRKRAVLATLALADPEAMTKRFSLILASQEVVPEDLDDVLEAKVRDVWDAIAGVDFDDRRLAARRSP